MQEEINELALFAGAGGGILASEILGIVPVCAVECDPYAQSILVRRQNEGHIPPFPIWDDIKTFAGRDWKGYVDLVSGGFPCQAFSTAAAGKNILSKNVWPEMERVVAEVMPRYVFAENVSASAVNQASSDLQKLGYHTEQTSVSAADLGADHIRKRYWVLAYTDDPRKLLCAVNAKTHELPNLSRGVWESYPDQPRVVNGMAYRLDRLRATGNGQVPIVAAAALLKMVRNFEDKYDPTV